MRSGECGLKVPLPWISMLKIKFGFDCCQFSRRGFYELFQEQLVDCIISGHSLLIGASAIFGRLD